MTIHCARLTCLFALSALRLLADEALVTALFPGTPLEIFIAPGRATTLQLRSAHKVAAISLASQAITYKYDRALNQLELAPTTKSVGVETNLNLRIGPHVYVLLVRIVNDVRAHYLRVLEPRDAAASDDESGLGEAPPLKPGDVGLVEAVRVLERALADPVFRAAQPQLRFESIGHLQMWNDCLVALRDVTQFLDRDLLIFRVLWENRTADVLHLELSQYALTSGGRSIPVVARYKRSGDRAVVAPGERETVYLAVQGQRLSRHNPWELQLPPDAAAVAPRLLR